MAAASAPAPPSAPAGRLSWGDPPGWKREAPANTMRIAQYVLPKVAPDKEDGECVVTTFGPGQGGTTEQNLDRWIRQFAADDKTTLDKSKRTVNGLAVTTLEMTGTYNGMGQGGPKAGTRMLASVVETPNGTFFFKTTGPDATVLAAKPAYEDLIGSLTTAGK